MKRLMVIENKGQRVLTTQQLASCYETTEKRISANFNSNKERYIEGKHYFYLEGDNLNEFLQSRNSGIQNSTKVRSLYLWTERGALFHAKSLNTDKAWEVYDYLVENYFRVKERALITRPNGDIKLISMLHAEVGELITATSQIKNRVETLENTMTIDYSEQLTLQEIARKVAIEIMGGKEGVVYKNSSLRSRVFTKVWKDYKEYVKVNSYKNTAKVDFEKGKKYLINWTPQGKLLRDIEDMNSKLNVRMEE